MIELLRTRRSIRKFEDRQVGSEAVKLLAEALLRCPTSMGKRPWEFVFVEDRETLAALSELKPTGAAFLAGAPLAVVILGDGTKSDVWVEDCSIAAIILQLAAHGLGLGSCWVQVRKRPLGDPTMGERCVRDLLGIPARLRVLAVVGLGHAAEEKEPVSSSELPWGKIHRDSFGGS